VDLARLSRRLRDRRVLALVVLTNLVGIAYGFIYYVPQFARTPVYLWPLVPDSPMAVLSMTVALGALVLDRSRPWLNLLGAGAMVKVGLWTAVVLAWFPEHFGFALVPELGCPTGVLGCGNLNTILFYGHLGMALEALVVLDELPGDARTYAAIGGLFAVHDVIDYAWPIDHLERGCPGVFPHTVPCDHLLSTFTVTLALSLLAVLGLAWGARRAGGGPGEVSS
jgi:uncharacterized membrane protein YpjA